jgi:hypothetical protein
VSRVASRSRGLAVAAPLFLLIFASTYFLISARWIIELQPEHDSNRCALYFTVTTFATVG